MGEGGRHGARGLGPGIRQQRSSAARSSQPDSTAPFAVRGIAFRTSLVVWYVSSVRARNSRAPPGHQGLPRPFLLWRSQNGSTKLQWVVVDELERHRGEEHSRGAARGRSHAGVGRIPYGRTQGRERTRCASEGIARTTWPFPGTRPRAAGAPHQEGFAESWSRGRGTGGISVSVSVETRRAATDLYTGASPDGDGVEAERRPLLRVGRRWMEGGRWGEAD